MQLAPVLMALRDSGRASSGSSSTPTSPSRGPAPTPWPSSRRRSAAHVAGEPMTRLGLSPPDRLQRAARDRRLPRQRLHQGGVEGRHGEPQDPAPARPPDQLHGRPGARSSSATPRRSTSRRASRSRPTRARALFAAVPGVVVQDDPASHVYPLAIEAAGRDEIFVGRVRQDPSIADGRGLAFWVVSRQPAQGRRDERGRDRRAARRARLDPAGRPTAAPAWPAGRQAGVTEAGAPSGARRDRRGGPGLHATAGSTRRGPGRCRARATPTPRSSSSARARASTRTARGGRSSVPAGTLLVKLLGSRRLAARGRVHHEHRQVPAARQSRPRARRDRGLRAVPAAPARGRSTRPSS